MEYKYRRQAARASTDAAPWTGWHTIALPGIVLGIFLINHFMPSTLRLASWVGTLGLLTLFAGLAGQGVTGLWLGLLIDSRNKVSLSRLQMIAWTVMLLSAFLTAVLHNLDGGYAEPLAVTIPTELWVLMGISTAALVASPLLVQAKKNQPASEAEKLRALDKLAQFVTHPTRVAIEGHLLVNQSAEDASLLDLFRGSETSNAGQLDLAKLQAFFFTLILWLSYGAGLAEMFRHSVDKIAALPTLESGMLVLLAVSHAGYLVTKALPTGNSL